MALPSNASMDLFPDNSPGNYTTRLPRTYNLTKDYEVGLAEVIFSRSFFNIDEGEVWIEFISDKEKSRYEIPAGVYQSGEDLVEILNDLIRHKNPREQKINFTYLKPTRQVTMKVIGRWVSFQMSPAFKNILQFDTSQSEVGLLSATSTGTCLLNPESVFIYCDVIESRAVGHSSSPLLRILPATRGNEDITHFIYQKPHYVTLGRTSFQTIEILLTKSNGKPLKFTSGVTYITLHFRRKRH